jgi:hypothetical protein
MEGTERLGPEEVSISAKRGAVMSLSAFAGFALPSVLSLSIPAGRISLGARPSPNATQRSHRDVTDIQKARSKYLSHFIESAPGRHPQTIWIFRLAWLMLPKERDWA